MVRFILRALIVAAGLWVASKIVPNVAFVNGTDLLLAAVLLGLANALIRPVLFILTLPITLVTLGLFALVVNGAMVWLVDLLLPGFATPGLWTDILVALVVGVTGWVASMVLGSDRRPAQT